MENVNPPPALDPPVLPTTLRAKVVQELLELQEISANIDSRLDNIDQFLSNFATQPNITDIDGVEPNNGSVDTPLVYPFLDSHDNSDDGKINMIFHQALDLIFKLDETTVGCTQDILRQRDRLNRFSKVSWVIPAFIVLEGEPKIDAMMRDFLDPSRWKELSKETSSKILLGGDGSCRKTFKPIASLIAKGKLK
ncbi:hypothetical protein Tco_1052514 [Tanacetum coccineum]